MNQDNNKIPDELINNDQHTIIHNMNLLSVVKEAFQQSNESKEPPQNQQNELLKQQSYISNELKGDNFSFDQYDHIHQMYNYQEETKGIEELSSAELQKQLINQKLYNKSLKLYNKQLLEKLKQKKSTENQNQQNNTQGQQSNNINKSNQDGLDGIENLQVVKQNQDLQLSNNEQENKNDENEAATIRELHLQIENQNNIIQLQTSQIQQLQQDAEISKQCQINTENIENDQKLEHDCQNHQLCSKFQQKCIELIEDNLKQIENIQQDIDDLHQHSSEIYQYDEYQEKQPLDPHFINTNQKLQQIKSNLQNIKQILNNQVGPPEEAQISIQQQLSENYDQQLENLDQALKDEIQQSESKQAQIQQLMNEKQLSSIQNSELQKQFDQLNAFQQQIAEENSTLLEYVKQLEEMVQLQKTAPKTQKPENNSLFLKQHDLNKQLRKVSIRILSEK